MERNSSPKKISRKMRGKVEAAIETLIALLDAAEPDADEEPSLGSLTSSSGGEDQELWARGSNDDREDEHDGAEPEIDESSLGSVAASPNVSQEHWAQGNGFYLDCEKEHDGREPDGRKRRGHLESQGALHGQVRRSLLRNPSGSVRGRKNRINA